MLSRNPALPFLSTISSYTELFYHPVLSLEKKNYYLFLDLATITRHKEDFLCTNNIILLNITLVMVKVTEPHNYRVAK